MRILAGTLLAAAALAFPAAARAGTYEVYACAAANAYWDNRSWTQGAHTPAGIAFDLACPAKAGESIGLAAGPGASTPDGAEAAVVFRAAPGTTIADFRLNRRLVYDNGPVEGAHAYYATYTLGALTFAGAGEHPRAAALAQQRSWYANPSTTAGVVTRASFPALAGYQGDATYLSIRVGCAAKGTPCKLPAGDQVQHQILGAVLTVTDSGAPDPTVAATGLLAGGQRHGSDPVTVSATDASGIRRVEIVDVTGTHTVVGTLEPECSARLAKPCPNLNDATITPSSLQPGRRRLVVRFHDAAGNAVDRGPFDVDVVSPSDRGAPNGLNATETATLTAVAARKVTRQNGRVRITGRLVNASGAPVADAILRVRTRDLHRDAFVERGSVVTGADGSFAYTATAYASRQIQFGWLARQRDTRFAANAYVTVRARASATLEVPRVARVGRTFTLRGRLRGVRPGRVPAVVAQGRSGRGRFATFRLGRASRDGRFRLRYRFRDPASRGRTFSIRVLLLPRGGWPYEDGRTRTVRVRVR